MCDYDYGLIEHPKLSNVYLTIIYGLEHMINAEIKQIVIILGPIEEGHKRGCWRWF
jgi:hypothetical protein